MPPAKGEMRARQTVSKHGWDSKAEKEKCSAQLQRTGPRGGDTHSGRCEATPVLIRWPFAHGGEWPLKQDQNALEAREVKGEKNEPHAAQQRLFLSETRSTNVRLRVLVVPPHDRDAKVRQDGHQREQYCSDNEGTHGAKQRVRAKKRRATGNRAGDEPCTSRGALAMTGAFRHKVLPIRNGTRCSACPRTDRCFLAGLQVQLKACIFIFFLQRMYSEGSPSNQSTGRD